MQAIGQHYKVEVRKSPIHGWGVFALEDIPGNVYIETSPGIVMHSTFLDVCHFAAGAEGLKPEEIILDQYGIGWLPGSVFIPLGWIGLYNHSEEPNAEFFYRNNVEILSIRSRRDITAGEEICVHYGPTWWETKPYLRKV
jgi:hypothetical protein